MAMTDGYPFTFVMTDRDGANDILKDTLQYHFKSSKSNHMYIVRVERYVQHIYCLKFYDKSTRDSKNKYSLRTNTFEPRTILYTLYHIMLDVLKRDRIASFFFIGADDERDIPNELTRRYKVYRRFVSSTITDKVFDHYRVNELSLYILVNKSTGADTSDLANIITEKVRETLRDMH